MKVLPQGPLRRSVRFYEGRSSESLHLRGDSDLLSKGVRVSVVGSREASSSGLARARKLSRLLVERGIIVVSGLVRGIDTAAHTAALQSGGKTISILGTSLSQFSTVENRQLQEEIGRDHLLVSQFPEGKPVQKGNFPLRNRLMALISDATVIIEAQDGSGTTHQGWEALRLARPLWIPSSVVEEASLKWPKEFLNYGARILSDDSLDEFNDLLPEPAWNPSHHVLPF